MRHRARRVELAVSELHADAQNVDGLLNGRTRRHSHMDRSGGSVLVGCAASPGRWREDTVPLAEIPPRCPHCGG
jgi:hypothetical protein